MTPLAPPEGWVEKAAEQGIEFEPGDVERLGHYLALLLAANEHMNLTGVRDAAEAWTRHILDSLTLIQLLTDLPPGASVIDVGSGGGLPGVPLAITMPTLRFTLLEATGKKTEFLRQAIAILGLDNARVIKGRAEDAGQDRGERTGTGRTGGHREAYDAVVARAVGPLSVLAEITVPFAKPPSAGVAGGVIALIKGQKADEELAAAKESLHQLKAVHETTVETPTGRIVVLSKGAATPKLYPRANGEPKRAPMK